MTLVVRKIVAAKPWEAWVGRGFDPSNLPSVMLGEFIPSRDEGDHFSVYAIAAEDEAARIAGAMAMIGSSGPSRTLFAFAKLADLEAAGVVLEATLGATFVAKIDGCHRNLKVPNLDTISTVAAIFAANDPLIVEAAQARNAVLQMAGAGEYDFAEIAGQKSKVGQRAICDSALVMVGGRHLVMGCP